MLFLVSCGVTRVELVRAVIRAVGRTAECFESLEAALDASSPAHPGCIVADASMTTPEGVGLVRDRMPHLALVSIIGPSDAHGAIQSLRNGVSDCIVEPFQHEELLSVLDRALAESKQRLAHQQAIQETRRRLDSLTERELEVMPLICDGLSNKQVAAKLDISIKTVAHHRSQILKKTEARNTAHMVQLVTLAHSITRPRVSGRAADGAPSRHKSL